MLVSFYFAVALFFMSVFIKVLLYFNKEILSSLIIPLKDTSEKENICSLFKKYFFHPITLVSI